MTNLEARIEKLEAPSLYGVPLIIDGFGCENIEEARAKYEENTE